MTRETARKSVYEVARIPPRMAKAYLAETYDGIGAVVKVAMTRGGVTNALNARVAAGDFGGGRIFPEGTPVMVSSYKGHLEVLLGNIPKIECNFDSFKDRELPDSWGAPSSNPTFDWFTSGGSAILSVADGFGQAITTSTDSLQAIYQGNNGSGADDAFKNGFILTFKFKFSGYSPDGYVSIIFNILDNFITATRFVRLYASFDETGVDPPFLIVGETGNAVDYQLPHSPPPDTIITIVWEYRPGVVSQAKIWWDTEPEDWQVSFVPSNFTSTWARILIATDQYSSIGIQTWSFDCISFAT